MRRELGMPVLDAAAALVLLRLFTFPGFLHVCEFPEAPRLCLSVSLTVAVPWGSCCPVVFARKFFLQGKSSSEEQ